MVEYELKPECDNKCVYKYISLNVYMCVITLVCVCVRVFGALCKATDRSLEQGEKCAA